jgi:hypothetical protein
MGQGRYRMYLYLQEENKQNYISIVKTIIYEANSEYKKAAGITISTDLGL